MTICSNCGKPFLDCCEDRELCDRCLKKAVHAKVAGRLKEVHAKVAAKLKRAHANG